MLTILSHYWTNLTQVSLWAWVACLGVALIWLPLSWHSLSLTAHQGWGIRLARYSSMAVVLVLGLWHVWHLKWVGDDAFISFRYARNLVEGHGLVFNPGEQVEGYTNFLWLLLIAGTIALGFNPLQSSIVLGMGVFALVMLVVELLRRISPTAPRFPSIALPTIAASYVMASYGTSGLETLFAAALVLCALLAVETRRLLLGGGLAAAAALAHPDHILFYVSMGLCVLRKEGLWAIRVWGRFAAPFFLFCVPWFLWRWSYYGDFYPNTYYAKSASQAYFSQGFTYLTVCITAMGLWWILPSALVGAWQQRQRIGVQFCALALPLYLVYVAKIGGDFMLGRLLVLPALLLTWLAALHWDALLAQRRWVLSVVVALCFGLSALPVRLIPPHQKPWNIADERTFYPVTAFRSGHVDSLYTEEASTLNRHLVSKGLTPLLATDCVGIVGYETRLPIFDLFGLTSRSVAHSPIAHRSRPGHEKYGTAGQVLEAGVLLSKIPVYPPPYDVLTRVHLDRFVYHLTTYQPELADHLSALGQLAAVEPQLQALAQRLPSHDAATQACDTWFASRYYFQSRNPPDPATQALATTWLNALGATQPEAAALRLFGQPPDTLGYQPTRQLDFTDIPAQSWRDGAAFEANPMRQAVVGQAAIWGAHGSFINSYSAANGDAATGRLVLPPFTLDGDLLTFTVGGGQRGVAVNLWVDHQLIHSASGCNTEVMRQVAWDVHNWAGREATLEIVDDSASGWGHIVVDEFTLWQRAPRSTPATE